MTSSHHGPYGPGYHDATMARTEGLQASDSERIPKSASWSDWSLQLDSMKSESLVIANQNVAVNTFQPCTHRPSHHGSGLHQK